MRRICVIGSANVDMTVSVDRFPHPGETIFGSQFEQYSGGKGANQAVCCAKLGIETDFIGKMGNDGFMEFLFKSMGDDGVNLNNVFFSDTQSTGLAFISVNNTGENQIIVVSGSNMDLGVEDIDEKREVIRKADIVLFQLEIPFASVIEGLKVARDNNCTTILNPAPAKSLPDELFENVDYLTPNETELEILTGRKLETEKDLVEAANELTRKGVKNVIITLGKNGALWVEKEQSVLFPARKVKAVDTTAAGDAFNGALAVGLCRGMSTDKSIEYAIKVSSISVTRHGAQTSMPTGAEVDLEN